MHIMSTHFAKTLVWKHEYDVKLWRHKHRTPQTNDHHMSLNETPPWKNFLRPPLFINVFTRARKAERILSVNLGEAISVIFASQVP